MGEPGKHKKIAQIKIKVKTSYLQKWGLLFA